MRRLGSGAKTITATPRQLESLIRLSEALAKMRFADWVEPRDVSEAIRLMKVSQCCCKKMYLTVLSLVEFELSIL
jgi:DNA replication licensing factor MCM4